MPALLYESLTRFYDPVLRATLKEDRFKRLLVEQAARRPGHRVLVVGWGTATLTILLKQACAEFDRIVSEPRISSPQPRRSVAR